MSFGNQQNSGSTASHHFGHLTDLTSSPEAVDYRGPLSGAQRGGHISASVHWDGARLRETNVQFQQAGVGGLSTEQGAIHRQRMCRHQRPKAHLFQDVGLDVDTWRNLRKDDTFICELEDGAFRHE